MSKGAAVAQIVVAVTFGLAAPADSDGRKKAPELPIKHYRYIRWMSTGQNEFVLSGKTAIAIYIDGSKAPNAYDALYSLDPTVSAPNVDGNIVLVGYLDPTQRKPLTSDVHPGAADPPGSIHYRLVLKDWYLAGPFNREKPRSPEEKLDGKAPEYILGMKLRRQDFDTSLASSRKLDWRSASFKPERYVRRLKLRPITHDDYDLALYGVSGKILQRAGWKP